MVDKFHFCRFVNPQFYRFRGAVQDVAGESFDFLHNEESRLLTCDRCKSADARDILAHILTVCSLNSKFDASQRPPILVNLFNEQRVQRLILKLYHRRFVRFQQYLFFRFVQQVPV